MAQMDPGSAREEAERLVATALAAARLAAAGQRAAGPVGQLIGALGRFSAPAPGGSTGGSGGASAGSGAAAGSGTSTGPGTSTGSGAAAGGGGFATGSAECCVCPLCRAIAALRDPSPEFAERLSTGAGDLAAGVTSLLRALVPPATDRSDRTDGPVDRPADPVGEPGGPVEQPAGPSRVAPAAGSGRPGGAAPGQRGSGPAAGGARSVEDPDLVWRAATRTRHDAQPVAERDVWAAATTAEPDPADDDVRPAQ
ncbi:hypothetical protein ACFFHU_19310 [Plantactinospora siamensis]|uniref:Uncharacterized protein n=1 Tax=Plantactinospora siamensis TaxID=555372 RepID=A0ABV6NZS0_9ACTN